VITLTFEKDFPVSVEELFAWHERPGAFLRLNPPYEPVKLVSHTGGIRDGAVVSIRVPLLGSLGIPWTLTHKGYNQNQCFEDHQLSGPFQSWQHRHRFERISDSQSRLIDEISFSLPLAMISEPLVGWIFKQKLTKLFAYRHRMTANDLAIAARYRNAFPTPQKFLISGATGFLGASLVAFLLTAGHDVAILTRGHDASLPEAVKRIPWDPYKKIIHANALEGFDHVIHLSGESVAQRWTKRVKERLLSSRTETTSFLASTLSTLTKKPKSFIAASGSAFYGVTTQDAVDESSPQGSGFLGDVVKQWEAASMPLAAQGVRVCHARFGIILSPDGGALQKMMPPFLFGAGGPIGDGSRSMSCIAKDDVIYGLYHLAATPEVSGAVNFCLPNPTTNKQFSETLAHVLGRPCLFPVPPAFLTLIFGEMATETILSSQQLVPKKLLDSHFSFTYPTLEAALRGMLGR
jgi:uncharacterized protein (TIGR01777 family)